VKAALISYPSVWAIKDVATPALTAIAAANFRENMSIPQSITRYI
jgi:hypothetical protein